MEISEEHNKAMPKTKPIKEKTQWLNCAVCR